MNPVCSCARPKTGSLQCFYISINTVRVRLVKVMLILSVLQGGECSGKVTDQATNTSAATLRVYTSRVALLQREFCALRGAQ